MTEIIARLQGRVVNSKEEESQILFGSKGPESPFGLIQWKGTDVCIDIHCKCGYHTHFDGYFAYYIKCPSCETIFCLNPKIELIEVTYGPTNCVQEPEIDD